MTTPRAEQLWAWRLAWTPVFALNLVVPYLWASHISEMAKGRGGWVGLHCGIAAFWALGVVAFARWPASARPVVAGGLVVALNQFLPVLHLFVGLAAITAVEGFTHRLGRLTGVKPGSRFHPSHPEIATFVEVFLTGGVLVFLAYQIGRVILPSKPGSGETGLRSSADNPEERRD